MLFKRRKKDKIPTNPNAVTVNWIVLGVLVFGVANNYRTNQSPSSVKSTAELKEGLKQAAPDAALDFHGISLKNILPASVPSLSIKDMRDGEGEPAVCGQKVAIAYSAADSDTNTLIDDSVEASSPMRFTIGDDRAIPAFEQGIIGMRKGGTRVIYSPWESAYGVPRFARSDVARDTRIAFRVEMIDINPPLPDSETSPFRISDIQRGNGRLIMCSDSAKVHITLFDIEGKKLFSTHDSDKPITFKTGKSEVFLGLEQGVIGMNEGGKRNLVVPPAFQKTMNGKLGILEIPFPAKQTVLVDVETLP